MNQTVARLGTSESESGEARYEATIVWKIMEGDENFQQTYGSSLVTQSNH